MQKLTFVNSIHILFKFAFLIGCLSHVLVSSYTLSLSCEASVVRDARDTAVAALPSGTRTLGLGGQ